VRPLLILALTPALAACASDPADTTSDVSSSSGAAASFGSTDNEAPTTSDATSDATSSDPTTTTTAQTTDPATTDPSATGSTGDDSTTGADSRDDEALLRQAIAGEVDPEEAMRTIADRGGFPVETAGGSYLFACLCGAGDWQLAGAHDEWVGAPMELAGPMRWAEAEVPAPDGSLYKFHELGDDAWIADPLGRRYGYDDNGRFSLVRASAAHLERWYDIAGAGLAPRDLQVHVPDDGAFTHALYVHDGQNLFDPGAMFGYWQLQDSVPPAMLLVGIDNTLARFEEYTHVVDDLGDGEVGGQGAAYAELVDTIVRPRMEAEYGDAAVVGTMGSSLGGLVALIIADIYPDRYDMAISLSGTMGWGSLGLNNETIIERYAAAGKRDFAIYLDSGGNGPCADDDMDGIEDDSQSGDNYCENAQLLTVLQGLGWSEGADLWYVHTPGALHNEAAWALRAGGAMTNFAGL